MSTADDRDKALAELLDMVLIDAVPCLSQEELEDILDRNARAISWSSGLTVNVGQVIQPDNGRRYRVERKGVTGTLATVYPISQPWYGESFYNRIINDGTAQLIDYGDEYKNLYDVRAAAYEAWNKKLGRASQLVTAPGMNMEQVFQHCKTMRDSFQAVLIG